MDLFFRVLEFVIIGFLLIYSAYKTWDNTSPNIIAKAVFWRILFFIFMVYNLFKGRYILVATLDAIRSLSE